LSRGNGSKGNGKTRVQDPLKKPLSDREQAFVQLCADFTDARSIGDKALASGYSHPNYGYKVYHKPHVLAAIHAEIDRFRERCRSSAMQLLHVMHRKGMEGDTQAAALYFKASGFIDEGNKQIVTIHNAPSVEEAIDTFAARRLALATTDEG
jgi:hypothetical protein